MSVLRRLLGFLVAVIVGVVIANMVVTHFGKPGILQVLPTMSPTAAATDEPSTTPSVTGKAPSANSGVSCAKAIKYRPIYAAKGVYAECVPPGSANLHGSDGYSYVTATSIHIWINRNSSRPIVLMAHELAHGYGWQKLSDAQRAAFSKKLGKADWNSGTYPTRPTEVWAYNQGRCHGYPANFTYTKVACSVIASYEKKAKANK